MKDMTDKAREIKLSKCCEAVMDHNNTWCGCCDRPSQPKTKAMDCPKCKREKTLGQLITGKWYCWACNYLTGSAGQNNEV